MGHDRDTHGVEATTNKYLAAALRRISQKRTTAGGLMAGFSPEEKAIIWEAADRLGGGND